MKKVLIISASQRVNSNSDILAKKVLQGVLDSGKEAEYVALKDKNIAFCKGCLACQKLKKCVIKDDANEITDKICEADVIVWATPIYYYEMSGQMKTMIDRANSLYVRDRKFKEVYLLATAADDDPKTIEKAYNGLQGWVDCFEGVELKGYFFVGGVWEAKEIENNPKILEAYDFGKNI